MTLRAALIALAAGVALAGSASAAQPSFNPGWEQVDAALARNDPAEARRIAEELAKAGHPEAINGLAALVAQGIGGPPDPVRYRELLERAVAAGSLTAKLNLARALASDSDTRLYPRALSLLQDVIKEPKLGGPTYYPLGRVMIFGGHGADELKQGVAYMAQAVAFEPQNADAQFLLARAYQGGWGGSEKNAAKAFEHFLAASKLGDERAERYVGMARLNGQGTAKDPPAALADFRSAAAHGSVWAMIDIAAMLAVGEGVPADPPAARDWYRRAADLGSAHGVRGLGVMLYRGEGGAVDTANGRALLELAVEAGDADAKRLAPLLFQGREAPDRAAIDAAKAAWLQSHPPPKAD